MTRRRWAAGLMCLVILAYAGGCTDDESEADTGPTPSSTMPTPSPTASDSPDQPVEPEPPTAMKGSSAKAANAFIRYYWDVVNYAQVTGDTAALRDLGYDLCEQCSVTADAIDRVYRVGGYIKGAEFTVSKIETTRLQSGDQPTYSIDFTATGSKQTIVEERGAKPQHRQGGVTRIRFLVGRNASGEWRLSQWEIL